MKKLPIFFNQKTRLNATSLLIPIFLFSVFFAMFNVARSGISELDNERFQNSISLEAQSISKATEHTIDLYSGLLESLRALFISEEEELLERIEWEKYVESLDVPKHYSAVSAVGFVKRVDKNEKEYVDLVRNDRSISSIGYPEFIIHPEANNKEKYIVHYITPMEGNEDAFGFDLFSNPSRASAIELARDTNSIVITEPINLVQGEESEKSFLMILPIYKIDESLETLDERREHIIGVVSLVVRSKDLFSEIISGSSFARIDALKVVDVTNENKVLLPFFNTIDLEKAEDISDVHPSVQITRINVASRAFVLEFHSHHVPSEVGFLHYVPFFGLLAGLIISILVGVTLSSSTSLRFKAEKIAGELTKDLEKFKLAIENVSDQIVISDAEGNVLYANAAMEKITGYTREEAMKSKAGVLWGKLMSDEYYKKMWDTIKVEKKVFDSEIENKRKDGTRYKAEIKISPILDKNDDVSFFVAIERDISEEKRIDEMKTQFISLASHQLRTPLSAMKWFLEMLITGDVGKLTKEQMEVINNIDLSNTRMINLVNGLLDVSRIESGRIMVDPELIDIKEFMGELLEELDQSVKEKDLQITSSFADDLEKMLVDRKLIHEIYNNLLTNAIKYSPSGGKISINIKKDDNNLISEVIDEGMGIPEGDKEKIFDKFHRGSNAIKLDTDGTGLGLYLVKTIVELSGGKIKFESVENQGTTFSFTLPLGGMKAKKGEVRLGSKKLK